VADWLIIIRNRTNEKVAPLKAPECFAKGDIIEILPLGTSPGTGAEKLSFFSYGKIEGVTKASIKHLKELLFDQTKLDGDGMAGEMKRKRRYTFPDSVTDTLNLDWKNPTVIKLGLITLVEKA